MYYFVYLLFLLQSYRKSHEKAPDMTENRMPGVQVLN